jgi:hypothetical protein
MSDAILGLEQVSRFVELARLEGMRSTGASVVNESAALYNVRGSSNDPKHDPKHPNDSWKGLLIKYGINGNEPCYVTDSIQKTHPQFNVGGHMTKDTNGVVNPNPGGSCFLMPLCSYHNHFNQKGAFSHTKTKMLLLTGYMKAELAATFMLRLPSEFPYAMLYWSDGQWDFINLNESDGDNFGSDVLSKLGMPMPDHYVLVQRIQSPDTLHIISKVCLPGVELNNLKSTG